LSAIDGQLRRTGGDRFGVADIAVFLRLHRTGSDPIEATLREPFGAHRRQSSLKVDRCPGIGIGARTVIGAIRFLPRRGIERDFAKRDTNIRPARRRTVNLVRADNRAGGYFTRASGGLRLDRHWRLLIVTFGHAGWKESPWRWLPFLRRHDPVQVQGFPHRRLVPVSRPLSPIGGAPLGRAGRWPGWGRVSNVWRLGWTMRP